MRLFEAIVQANQRGQRGEEVGIRSPEFADELPLAVLTCIDARLNKLVPEALGVPEDKFIWLRNAGNIITGQLSSTMRSLALACGVKGARGVAIVGHTDCLVGSTTVLQLTERFRALGILRDKLPENLVEYFGLFASERQNVLKGVEIVRASPLIGPKVPVHGLLLDIQSGSLEWLVNGYQVLETASTSSPVLQATREAAGKIGDAVQSLEHVVSEVRDLKIGEIKFPSAKIGEIASAAGQWVKETVEQEIEAAVSPSPGSAPGTTPPLLTAMEMARRLDPAKRFKVIGRDQKLYGPVTVAELLAWLADNRIDHTTPVQREDSASWKPLGSWLHNIKDEIGKQADVRFRRRR